MPTTVALSATVVVRLATAYRDTLISAAEFYDDPAEARALRSVRVFALGPRTVRASAKGRQASRVAAVVLDVAHALDGKIVPDGRQATLTW